MVNRGASRFFWTGIGHCRFRRNLGTGENHQRGTGNYQFPGRGRGRTFPWPLCDKLHFSQARTPAYPGTVFNNIFALQVSDGRALKALVQHLEISTADVMAVGDGSNDILSAAGLAVAMGSAPAEVKATADYITFDVGNSGLAAVIYKFLL